MDASNRIIPLELVEYILSFVLSPIHDCRVRFRTVVSVCRAWRHIALAGVTHTRPCGSNDDALRRDHAACVCLRADPDELFMTAVSYGSMTCAKRIREHYDIELEKARTLEAATNNRLEALKWLRKEGCPWDKRVCASAARGGHLELIRWARINGCSWDEVTCYNAASAGHLAILKWARASGCPWNHMICAFAAARGHLEVLQWARANGCPWDEETAPVRREPAIWMSSSGHAQMDAPGTSGPAHTLQCTAAWRCSDGRVPTAVLGTSGLAFSQSAEATWRCSSGHAPTAAHEIKKSTVAKFQREAQTMKCYWCRERLARRSPWLSYDTTLITHDRKHQRQGRIVYICSSVCFADALDLENTRALQRKGGGSWLDMHLMHSK
jgi:hypothetical protein